LGIGERRKSYVWRILTDAATGGFLENQMIAAMRVVLASSALLIIYLDPAEPAPREFAEKLTSLPDDCAFAYSAEPRWWDAGAWPRVFSAARSRRLSSHGR
jgi:hypothetical protein